MLLAVSSVAIALPSAAAEAFPVGVQTVEFRDPKPPSRALVMAVFYPAKPAAAAALTLPFQANLTIYPDTPYADEGARRPLVMLSHGRGGDRMNLAWLAQDLAAHGYIVAALDHYKANTYDRSIAYLANRIWQRPVDVSLGITHLLAVPEWRRRVDPSRIGVAGFSQGGFTALWIGGARVNPERFLAFQRRWARDPLLPPSVRRSLPVDAAPALRVHDPRVKAVFAMAPGIVQVFGFDEAGLAQLRVPTHIVAGAADTVVPIADNAEFAARHVPGATLTILPAPAHHSVFLNECTAEGKAELIEACADDPAVDRGALHRQIAAEALAFFDRSLGVPRDEREVAEPGRAR